MTDVLTGDAAVTRDIVRARSNADLDETCAELGIWLSSLNAFLANPPNSDAASLIRLTRSGLERCIRLNVKLNADGIDDGELSRALCEGLRQCRTTVPASMVDVRVYFGVLSDRLCGSRSFQRVVSVAERSGEAFLPQPLRNFVPKTEDESELALVLPRFGKILRWLSVVGRMLEADEPLKPSMLIFARVYEQVAETIAYINNRLGRFSNEEVELFGSLDAASYTSSIVLKKVFSPGFAGLLAVRPAPSVFAGVESAYSILNESFQQILGGLAGIVEPSVEVVSLFPQSRVNFERSLVLRRELWTLVRLTQAAEQAPEKAQVEALNDALRKFMGTTVRFLFYKDTETIERFVEEIIVTRQTKDLVPILHRFGAYLETLFGQVSLRAVLENHPFERQE
jgi:hypothetical protein